MITRRVLLLALFPWLCTERGLEVAGAAAVEWTADYTQTEMLVRGVAIHIMAEPLCFHA